MSYRPFIFKFFEATSSLTQGDVQHALNWQTTEGIIDSAGKVGVLNAEQVVQIFSEKAGEGKNIFSKLLITAKRTNDKQMEAMLDDGSKVLFRRDIGEYAHGLGGAYRGKGPINHYNIEIHVPNSDGGFKAKQNYHLILDEEFNVIDFIK